MEHVLAYHNPEGQAMSNEYERRTVEILIDAWEIEATGQRSDDPLTLVAELIYPRPKIARRDQIRVLPSQAGQNIIWSDRPFHRRILFKEIVEGPFSIGVTLRRNKSGSVFRALSGSNLRTSGDEQGDKAEDPGTPIPFGSTLEVLSEAGLEAFDESGFADVIATGTVALDPADPAEHETLTIDMISPARIHNPRPNPHPERHSDYEEFLKEPGEYNGQFTLEYSIFDR